jgi:hypothetical protein
MIEIDKNKIAYMTESENDNYNVRSFSLKNVGATYIPTTDEQSILK